MNGTPNPEPISTRLQKIAELARKAPDLAFKTLGHHIDKLLMREAYARTRKNGATGIDRITAAEYAEELESNLERLINRFKSGSYKASPVRRVYIPKEHGKTRPIGIPTFEDKVLQRAIVMILESIYEQDFYGCSYGFRPGRSALQMTEAVQNALTRMGGGWVLEVDIKSYFDTIRHPELREFLDKRVRDGVIRRTIGKWLKAGVWEGNHRTYYETGTPQGGVISPLLSNIYLHYVLDDWFEKTVKPLMKGQVYLFRYADDFIICFENRTDAQRLWEVLPKRLGKYGLELHPKKTRIIQFLRPDGQSEINGESESFDLLGFTHFWGRSRKGKWIVKQKTAKGRISRTLSRMKEWIRKNRHRNPEYQQKGIGSRLVGHWAYFGITGNYRSLALVYQETRRIWYKWLNRRSQRKSMNWEEYNRFLSRYPLPRPRIIHSIYQRT